MSKQIEAPTLRDWLDAHEPVTVVDIRTDDDYAQWAIPGSPMSTRTKRCATESLERSRP